jgi:acyl-CoA reductase-like NAD-dependent aldehyde dehydrogenase
MSTYSRNDEKEQTMALTLKNLVNGEFVEAGSWLEVTNPATNGEVVGQVPAMGPADLSAVFDAAEAGARAWRAVNPIERGKVLYRAAVLVREQATDLTELIVAEMGKTRAEASGEVGKVAEFLEYYGGLCRLPFGELLPDARPGTWAQQVREPLGVVVLITPWNDPLLTPARKLAPALAAGNAVVLKPATETPLIALRFAEILHQAGLVAGALGTITGRGSEIGGLLVSDRRIRAVSFTGSTPVGINIQRQLAGSGVRVQTEMGGKNAAVILDDADLDLAVSVVASGSFAQAGQRCTATSRLIVQRGVASEVERRMAGHIAELRVGPGSEDGVDLGPVVNVVAQHEIEASVQSALDDGAELIARTELGENARQGSFVAPGLLRTPTNSALWREEVFGPILGMTVVDDLDEAVAVVNDSAFGLSSAVFTTSLRSAHRFVDAVETGQVSVNQPTTGWDVHHPFGGFKDSGSPFKEQGLEALRFYTRVKTAAIRADA